MGEIKFTKKDTVVYREKNNNPMENMERMEQNIPVCVGLVGEVIGVECSKGSFSLKKSKAFQLKW